MPRIFQTPRTQQTVTTGDRGRQPDVQQLAARLDAIDDVPHALVWLGTILSRRQDVGAELQQAVLAHPSVASLIAKGAALASDWKPSQAASASNAFKAVLRASDLGGPWLTRALATELRAKLPRGPFPLPAEMASVLAQHLEQGKGKALAIDLEQMYRVSPIDSAPKGRVPLVHSYGYFQGQTPGRFDYELNARMIQPGMETSFGGGNGYIYPGTPEFALLKLRGAKLAKKIPIKDQNKLDAAGNNLVDSFHEMLRPDDVDPAKDAAYVKATADVLQGYIDAGWDYIEIDELNFHYADETVGGRRFRAVMEELGQRGYGRRMIVWFSPGTTDVTRAPTTQRDPLRRFEQLFQTARLHARKLVFEAYPEAGNRSEKPPPGLRTSTVLGEQRAARHLDSLALRLDKVVPGLSSVSIAGLGLVNDDRGGSFRHPYLNDPERDLQSLRAQLQELHNGPAERLTGVAWYAPSRVVDKRNDRGEVVYDRDMLSSVVAKLSAWWRGKD